jgi:hypothetical protein
VRGKEKLCRKETKALVAAAAAAAVVVAAAAVVAAEAVAAVVRPEAVEARAAAVVRAVVVAAVVVAVRLAAVAAAWVAGAKKEFRASTRPIRGNRVTHRGYERAFAHHSLVPVACLQRRLIGCCQNV